MIFVVFFSKKSYTVSNDYANILARLGAGGGVSWCIRYRPPLLEVGLNSYIIYHSAYPHEIILSGYKEAYGILIVLFCASKLFFSVYC